MGVADQKSRLPWWHRRVVVVTDHEAWASHTGDTIRALGGWHETMTWTRAATLEGPLGALVAEVDVASTGVDALRRWAAAGRQPKTLLWIPPSRRVARIGHTLDRLGYRHVFTRASNEAAETDLGRHLPRIVSRGGWVVPWFSTALGWSSDPFLVHVLSLPVLAARPPKTVTEWVRAVDGHSHAEFVRLCHERGAPSPKELYDRLRFSASTVWAAEQRLQPTGHKLARHLGYSSARYTGERARHLAGLTWEDLVERPVVDVIAALTRPILRGGSMPPGRFGQ